MARVWRQRRIQELLAYLKGVPETRAFYVQDTHEGMYVMIPWEKDVLPHDPPMFTEEDLEFLKEMKVSAI